MNMGQSSKIRGSGHLILNGLRVCNIITLLAVSVASWVMIVMTGIRNNFFFFDAASHFFTSCIAITLGLSEVGLFKAYFARAWPAFSPENGFTWLGMAMVVMGCHVLGNLNEAGGSAETLGDAIHRLILASGILALTFGVLNIACSFVFKDRKAGINARMIRSDGNLASAKPAAADEGFNFSSSPPSRSASMRSDREREEKSNNRWTRRFTSTFATGGKKLKISRPMPQHLHMPQHQDLESQYPEDEDWRQHRVSPILPDIKRPDTALHPMNTGVSRYSEVSHLPRF